MATCSKMASFSTRKMFKLPQYDPAVSTELQQLQRQGAEISDVKVALGEGLMAYLITYEAPKPMT
jgi:hypothetical protein